MKKEHVVKQMQKKIFKPISFIAINLWLIVIMNSCSNKVLIGSYVHNKNVPYELIADHQDDEYLELKKDSTFIYESFWSQYLGDDISSEYYSFLGIGKYQVLKDSLILNFIPKPQIGLSQKVTIPSRFIRLPYKIEDQSLIGRRVFLITIRKDSIKIGDLIKVKKLNINKRKLNYSNKSSVSAR